jgi:hypothetical protein
MAKNCGVVTLTATFLENKKLTYQTQQKALNIYYESEVLLL